MKLSVVILNYNVKYFLQQCLLSVEAAIRAIDAEIIVVDNNSTDGSCEMIHSLFPNVTLIANSENTGFPKGNNIGVALAKGEYICILNPDTVVAEDTFVSVLDYISSKQNAGIVGCRLIDGAGNFLPESKRGVPTPYVALTKIFGLYKLSPKLFGKYYASHLSEYESGAVDILVGAFMVMKRELYLEIGGFDENCFMYSDDIDLSYRVLKAGYQNFYFAGTSVIHYKGESTARDQLYMKRFSEAMNYFYKKHFEVSPIFNVFMKSGAALFALAKRKKKVTRVAPSNYILLSSDEALRMQVENLLESNIGQAQNAEQIDLNSLGSYTQLLFDNAECDFRTIIRTMQHLQQYGVSYRIIPDSDDGTRYIIGSDNSNDRGEIKIISSIT